MLIRQGDFGKEKGKPLFAKHYEKLCSLLSNHGGQLIIGNENAHQDRVLTPTIVLDPDLDSPLMKSEINGPILPVIEYGDLDFVISEIK